MPLVSIITPVYNAARWLPETLATVQSQTFADWEHILVDDCSTDESSLIAQEAAAVDPRIRLIRSLNKQGPSAARNRALEAARGRYIAFLDADDIWHPEKLERSVEWLESNGYAFIYHDYRHLSNDGRLVGDLITGPQILNMRTLHTRRGTGGCLSMVLDRQQLPSFHFPRNFRYTHEDFCGWLSILQMGHVGHRLPFDLGRYRLTVNSRSSNKLTAIKNTWILYREYSKLSLVRAALWWTQYVCSCLLLYLRARPSHLVSDMKWTTSPCEPASILGQGRSLSLHNGDF
jgi:glycosyltransferase involved in cell wall biosynthesis